jgi:hypothetical protein
MSQQPHCVPYMQTDNILLTPDSIKKDELSFLGDENVL